MSRAAGGRRSARQQFHPRAFGGDGDVEGARLHADVSRVDEARFAY